MGGDPDLEPSLGASEPVIAAHMLTGPDGKGYHPGDQERWAAGSRDDREHDAGDEPEEENEHGGDIQDEPHDPEEDCGPDAIVDAAYLRRRYAVETRTRELLADTRIGLDAVRRRKAGAAPAGALRVLPAHVLRGLGL